MKTLICLTVSVLCGCCLFFLSSCYHTPTALDACVSEETVADAYGNRDGVASEEELNAMDRHFTESREAWGIGRMSTAYRDESVRYIRADKLVSMFESGMMVGPYESENALCADFDGKDPLAGHLRRSSWVCRPVRDCPVFSSPWSPYRKC